MIEPGIMLSAVEVKIIGEAAVPSAIIFPPCAMINAVALAPVPTSPLTITPGSIVNVTPSTTAILDFNT